ncbi:hypothetical protein F4859DRAFT_523984 [Xylaria cf. heliscus]|nr:hypothetical protein F4859DRAFT_523984 [Xylaria cf. heliscus]
MAGKKDTVRRDLQRLVKQCVHNQAETFEQLQSGAIFEIEMLKSRTMKQKNILHLIAEHYEDDDEALDGETSNNKHEVSPNNSESIRMLVEGLLTKYPQMILEHDKDGQTPLHVAIDSDLMIEWICSKCPNLQDALKEIDNSKNNGVHLTIKSHLPLQLKKDLINKATEDSLMARDIHGHTPLHLAVEYKECTKSQLEVIQELVRKGDKALDVISYAPDYFSVFMYHDHTRVICENEVASASDSRLSHNNMQTINQKENNSQSSEQGPKNIDRNGSERREDGHDEGQMERVGPGSVHPATGQPERYTTNEGSARRLDGDPEKQNHTAPSKHHPYNGANVSVDPLDSGKEEVGTYAKEIREFIMLHYLRTRGAEEAAAWLYGKNVEGFQTTFDYLENESNNDELNVRDFAQIFDHFRFTSVLKSVHFRHVRLKSREGFKFGDRTSFSSSNEDGLTDMTFFFYWLYHSKSVARILKVTVEEDEDPSSDDVIENCLARLRVERLDWRKPDLCPEVIRKVGAELRAISLQWSGSNTALRAWSEQEGLVLCPKLERVTLRFDKRLESSDRVQKNIESFRVRLREYRPQESPIEVDADNDNDEIWSLQDTYPSQNMSGNSEKESSWNTHKWLECVDRFADKIQGIKDGSKPSDYENISLPDAIKRDIKVAIIDDGVDITQKALREKIIGGASFDKGARGHYRFSLSRHGTTMANMVIRVCPRAKIYVVKMNTNLKDGKIHVDSSTVAQAIQAAVDHDVDIISMSWQIKKPDENQERKDIDDALRSAISRGILMFCSSGDQGYLEEGSSYPSSYEKDMILRIGAATTYGKGRESTPEHPHYLLPGHEVVERKPKGLKGEAFTGSSVATALAAGLAALVFQCIKLGAIYTLTADAKDLAEHKINIRDTEFKATGSKSTAVRHMKAAFTKMGLNEHNSKFIEVWKLLESDPDMEIKWKVWTPKQRLLAIAKIGQSMVNARTNA